jgi:hypothetical protein
LARRFELGLEEPDPRRARTSALTIALSYIAGGLVPLAPYFFLRAVHYALVGSVVVTLLALLVFGYVKGRFTTARPLRNAWQTAIAVYCQVGQRGYLATRILQHAGFAAVNVSGGYKTYRLLHPETNGR